MGPGPMVYAAAYCPMSFKPTLEALGFDGRSCAPRRATSVAGAIQPVADPRLQGLVRRDETSAVGRVRRPPAIVLLERDALASGHLGGHVTAGTYQPEPAGAGEMITAVPLLLYSRERP